MTTDTAPAATNLPPEQLAELRDRARQEAGPFTDPCVMAMRVRHSGEWASAILGRPYDGERSLTWPERYLLHIAAQAEPCPPPPPQATAAAAVMRAELDVAARRREEEHARAVAEWDQIREHLPVPAEVRHNYTSHRHLGHYSRGADHIYLLEGITAGRLHRSARHVLCWTPSRARDLREFPEPATDGRPPSCRACLRTARRLAGLAA
ncbi:hypothetical protein ABZ820_12625 [Streptomyces diacarni]|uniref:hypothetical protein n=1 Tax=Streptomyces diacarni TaxID=2800381 RepID=UPI0033F5E524